MCILRTLPQYSIIRINCVNYPENDILSIDAIYSFTVNDVITNSYCAVYGWSGTNIDDMGIEPYELMEIDNGFYFSPPIQTWLKYSLPCNFEVISVGHGQPCIKDGGIGTDSEDD